LGAIILNDRFGGTQCDLMNVLVTCGLSPRQSYLRNPSGSRIRSPKALDNALTLDGASTFFTPFILASPFWLPPLTQHRKIMKKSSIALSLLTLVLSVGCSGKKEVKPVEAAGASAPAAPPAAANTPVSKEVPADIKGAPFEDVGSCSIDVVNNVMLGNSSEVAVKRADGLSVDGWAFDEKGAALSNVVVLQLVNGEERYYAQLNRHGGREDLIKAFGKSELANAGYAAAVDIATLPAGQYVIQVVQKSSGKNLVCNTNRKLNLNA
jgi:hypothetical protein